MNLTLWTAIREYVQAEADLAVGRLCERRWPLLGYAEPSIEALQERVTRMETIVREMLPESPPAQEPSK